VASNGQAANKGDAWYGAVVSADGRYVAFATDADNLVPNDGNGRYDVFRRDLRTGKTELVSVGLTGKAASVATTCTVMQSRSPSISADGRYVAFTSCAQDLVAVDTSTADDVFVRDMAKGVTTLVSVSSKGAPAAGGSGSGFQAISADGRYVAFYSTAPLVDLGSLSAADELLGATTGGPQVYVRDRVAGTTTLVSVSDAGEPGNAPSARCGIRFTAAYVGISADGHFVTFTSRATNLTSAPVQPAQSVIGAHDRTMAFSHVFLRDVRAKKTVMVDVAPDGSPATPPNPTVLGSCPYPSFDPSVSGDGRYVSFVSTGENLIPEAGHHNPTVPFTGDVFLRDMHTGRTVRVDVTSAGGNPRSLIASRTGFGTALPEEVVVSSDGRYTVFKSQLSDGDWSLCRHDRFTGTTEVVSTVVERFGASAPDTVDGRYVVFTGKGPGDSHPQVYRRDFGPALGVGGLAGSGALAVAGRYSFASTGILSTSEWTHDVNTSLADRGADLVGASMTYRAGYGDLFLRGLLRRMPAGADPTATGFLYGMDLTADGTRYQVRIQRTPGLSFDPAGGASFGLFRLESGRWTQTTTLRGGYGTTGEEVAVAVPLQALGLAAGGQIESAAVFTSVGSFATGAASVIDRVDLIASR
jgi:Tol biopolymer transport system component